jgi:hypothetical protein
MDLTQRLGAVDDE